VIHYLLTTLILALITDVLVITTPNDAKRPSGCSVTALARASRSAVPCARPLFLRQPVLDVAACVAAVGGGELEITDVTPLPRAWRVREQGVHPLDAAISIEWSTHDIGGGPIRPLLLPTDVASRAG